MSQAEGGHERLVASLLTHAAGAHALLLARLADDIAGMLPVDAQGITRAIDHLAEAIGFEPDERRELMRGHAMNPAVLHARVFGASGLSDSTVLAAFIDGARVRADAISTLADAAGGADLGATVRIVLADHPLPADVATDSATDALRDAYAAQEAATLLIARHLDAEI